MAERVYVALGSNLGGRVAALAFARERLAALPGIRLIAASGIEETAPIGGPPQGPYLNQMLLLETTLGPRALLRAGQAIEAAAGRFRDERWGPRTLDIDIVRFGSRTIDDDDLTVPHPGLPTRDFWRREVAALEPYDR